MNIFSKIKYSSIFILALASCNESSLELNSPNDVTTDGLITTEAGFEQLLLGGYDAYQKIPANEYLLTELRSDNSRANTETGNLPSYNNYTTTSADPEIANYWSNNFKVIFQANLIIVNRANLSSDSTILGEAYFLRALSHFNLVRAFRDVPYVDDLLTVDTFRNFPQLDEADTYARIVEDFSLAVNLLDQTNSSKRATKGAAEIYLAKTYLSQPSPNYAAAQALLEPMIGEDNIYGYELLDNFSDIFAQGDDTSIPELNEEIIFTIPYEQASSDPVSSDSDAEDQVESNAERWSFDMTSSGESNGVNLATLDLLNGRMNASDEPVRFYVTIDEDLFFSDRGVDLSPPLIDETLGTVLTDSNGNELIDEIALASELSGLTENLDVFNNKFKPDNAERSGNNWIMLRYSDVLLLYVESVLAGADLTSDATAIAVFDRVRERAGIDGLPAGSILTSDLLLEERRMEFVFENQRFYDLIRFGQAFEILGTYSDAADLFFELTDLYLPIPQREVDNTDGFIN